MGACSVVFSLQYQLLNKKENKEEGGIWKLGRKEGRKERRKGGKKGGKIVIYSVDVKEREPQ
jgi:hypothetical protein